MIRIRPAEGAWFMRFAYRSALLVLIAFLLLSPKNAIAQIDFSPRSSPDLLWFQTTAESITNRTAAGILTIPGAVFVWLPRRVMMLAGRSVVEITFAGGSIRNALGMVFIPRTGIEAGGGAVIIWTSQRVLILSAGFHRPGLPPIVSEIRFAGAPITNTLGVVFVPPTGIEVAGAVLFYTSQRVLLLSAGTVGELKFQGASIANTLGALFIPPTGAEAAGALVIWNPEHVLVLSAGLLGEFQFEGAPITDTLGVTSFGPAGREVAGAILIWTTEHIFIVSAGSISELKFQGQPIVSRVRIGGTSFRRQAGNFGSLYEAAGDLGSQPGLLIVGRTRRGGGLGGGTP